MAREHINPIYNLVAFIEHYFEDVRSIWAAVALTARGHQPHLHCQHFEHHDADLRAVFLLRRCACRGSNSFKTISATNHWTESPGIGSRDTGAHSRRLASCAVPCRPLVAAERRRCDCWCASKLQPR